MNRLVVQRLNFPGDVRYALQKDMVMGPDTLGSHLYVVDWNYEPPVTDDPEDKGRTVVGLTYIAPPQET